MQKNIFMFLVFFSGISARNESIDLKNKKTFSAKFKATVLNKIKKCKNFVCKQKFVTFTSLMSACGLGFLIKNHSVSASSSLSSPKTFRGVTAGEQLSIFLPPLPKNEEDYINQMPLKDEHRLSDDELKIVFEGGKAELKHHIKACSGKSYKILNDEEVQAWNKKIDSIKSWNEKVKIDKELGVYILKKLYNTVNSLSNVRIIKEETIPTPLGTMCLGYCNRLNTLKSQLPKT